MTFEDFLTKRGYNPDQVKWAMGKDTVDLVKQFVVSSEAELLGGIMADLSEGMDPDTYNRMQEELEKRES